MLKSIEQKDDKKEFNLWKTRIDDSTSERDEYAQEGQDHRDAYNGKSAGKINLVYPDVKQSVASNYAKNPKAYFEAENPESEKSAKIFEVLISHLIEKLKFKRIMRGVIRSAKFDPVVATKTYFKFELNLSKTVFNDSVHNDEIVTELVLCKSLIKDSKSKTYEKSPWIGHCDRDSADNLQKRFGLTDQELIKISHNSDTPEMRQVEGKERYKYIYTDYYEIEDRVNGEIFYIVKGVERILGKKKKEYTFDSMYDFFQPNYVEGAEECHGDLYYWRNQREAYNTMRELFNEASEKAVPKSILRGPWSEQQISDLKDNVVKGFVHCKDPTTTIEPLNHAQVDPSITRNLSMIQGEMQLISKNIIANMSGDKTATEIKSNEMAGQEIESEYREILEDMMASIFFKWAKLAQKFYTTKRVVKITGYTDAQYVGFKNDLGDAFQDDGKNKYLKFDKSQLEGEFTVKIEAGSTLPDNKQTRMNKFMGFTGFLSKIPEAKAFVNMERVIEEAQDVFDVRNEGLILAKNDPYAENKLLSSGVWVTPQMSDDDDYHLSIHMADLNDTPEKEFHMLVHKKQKMMKSQVEKHNMAMGAMNSPVGGMNSPMDSMSGANILQNLSPLPTQSVDAINPEEAQIPEQ